MSTKRNVLGNLNSPTNLRAMNKDELKFLAATMGIVVPPKSKRSEIVTMIRNQENEEPLVDRESPSKRVAIDANEIFDHQINDAFEKLEEEIVNEEIPASFQSEELLEVEEYRVFQPTPKVESSTQASMPAPQKKVNESFVSSASTLIWFSLLVELYFLVASNIPFKQITISLFKYSLNIAVVDQAKMAVESLYSELFLECLRNWVFGTLFIPLLVSYFVNFESSRHAFSPFTFSVARFALFYLHPMGYFKRIFVAIPLKYFQLSCAIGFVYSIFEAINKN